MTFKTRFAPSPTGPLHLGHAYSALLAYDMAQKRGGEFVLRIEDIDQSRARDHWVTQIYQDLEWLGLEWTQPVMLQSKRQAVYESALDRLWRDGFLFPCYCRRKDILAAAGAPQEGVPLLGPDGIVYPGTCLQRPCDITAPRPLKQALRLNIARCHAHMRSFIETGAGENGESGLIAYSHEELLENIGAVVLARKEMGTSYHLSVVLDDAAQGISHVVRGRDLFEATKIHVLLQELLGLSSPEYHHHDLIRDENGKRLAKRDDARAISLYRDEGYTAQDIRNWLGL